jgi:hypothetical protein
MKALLTSAVYRTFFSCLTDQRRPNAPPPLLRKPRLVEVQQTMTGAIQTIPVMITFRKSYKNSLEHRDGVYQSSRKTLYSM